MPAAPGRFAVLAAAQLTAGILSAPFVVEGAHFVRSGSTQAWMVVSWWLLAIFTLVVAPQWSRSGFPVSLLMSAVLVAVNALVAGDGQIQLLEGFGILVLGVVAACWMPPPLLRVFLAVVCALYVAAVILNPLLVAWWLAALVVVIVVALSEVTRHQVERLRQLAREDQLTGALNRKGLIELAPALRSLASRNEQPVSVAVLDLDAFKSYNDENGHIAGDELLVGVVHLWQSGLRPSDLVARVGGDEFVLVLPGSTTEQAANALTRLLRRSPAPWTIGIAAWSDDEDVMDAVERADRLMYQAKRPTPR